MIDLRLKRVTINVELRTTKEHRTIGLWRFRRQQYRWVNNVLCLEATFDTTYPIAPQTGDRVALIAKAGVELVGHIENPVWVPGSNGSRGRFECDNSDMVWKGSAVGSGRMVRMVKDSAHTITYACVRKGIRKGRWFPAS